MTPFRFVSPHKVAANVHGSDRLAQQLQRFHQWESGFKHHPSSKLIIISCNRNQTSSEHDQQSSQQPRTPTTGTDKSGPIRFTKRGTNKTHPYARLTSAQEPKDTTIPATQPALNHTIQQTESPLDPEQSTTKPRSEPTQSSSTTTHKTTHPNSLHNPHSQTIRRTTQAATITGAANPTTPTCSKSADGQEKPAMCPQLRPSAAIIPLCSRVTETPRFRRRPAKSGKIEVHAVPSDIRFLPRWIADCGTTEQDQPDDGASAWFRPPAAPPRPRQPDHQRHSRSEQQGLAFQSIDSVHCNKENDQIEAYSDHGKRGGRAPNSATRPPFSLCVSCRHAFDQNTPCQPTLDRQGQSTRRSRA